MRPGDDTPDDQAPDDPPRAPGEPLGGEVGIRPQQSAGFRLKPVVLHSQQPGGGASGTQKVGMEVGLGPHGSFSYVLPPQPPHPVVAMGAGRCPLRAGNCDNCGETSSPQWRRGPPSKPSLCNACGCRYKQSGETGLARISGRLAPGYVARSPQQAAAPLVKTDDGMPPPAPVDLALAQQGAVGDDDALPPSSMPPGAAWPPAPQMQQAAASALPQAADGERGNGGGVSRGAAPLAARERPPSRFASQGAVAATAALTGAPPRGQWMRGAAGEVYTGDVYARPAAATTAMPTAGGSAPYSFTSSLQAAVAAGAFEQQRMGWNTQNTFGSGSGGGVRFTRPSVPGSSDNGVECGFAGGQPRPQQAPKRKEGGGGGGRVNQPGQGTAAAPPRVFNFQKKRTTAFDAIPRGPEDMAAVAAEHGAMSLLPAPLAPDTVRCDCAHCEMPKLRKRCLRLLAADGHIGADVALGGAASCGLDVEVLWPRDDAFYLARVVSYDPSSRTHSLRYFIDGQRETRRLWTDILQWPSGTGAVSSSLNEQWTERGAAAPRNGPMRYPPVGWLTVRRHRALAEAATAEAVRSGTWAGPPSAHPPQVLSRDDGGASGYDAPPHAKRPKTTVYAAPSEPAAEAPGGGGGDVAMDEDEPQDGQLRSGRNMPPPAPRPEVAQERAQRVYKSAIVVPLTEEETHMLRGYITAMQQSSVPPPFEYWKALRRFSNKGLSREEMQREAQGKLQGTCRSLHAQLMALINAGSNGYKPSLAAMLAPLTESRVACRQLTAEARAAMPAKEAAEEEGAAGAPPAAAAEAAPAPLVVAAAAEPAPAAGGAA